MKKRNGAMRFGRLTALALAMIVALGLMACSSDSSATTAAENATEAQEETTAPAVLETETAEGQNEEPETVEPTYSLIQNVYNWGSNYSRIIIPVSDAASLDYLDADAYSVSVERFDGENNSLGAGERTVQAVYRSDEAGNESLEGNYVTLVMGVGASSTLASPYYNLATGLKAWAVCDYTVENAVTGETWNQLDTVYHPDEEGFDTASFTDEASGITMSYASYEPEEGSEGSPLIVWLHGFGSGGTDIGFVTGGMMVTNFITDEVQDIFGGAYILLPQAETMWMDAGDNTYSTDGSSIYAEPVMALIADFVENNPGIDPNRIYVGGCSNGGYLTMELVLDNPDYFAAAFPVCEYYLDEWITDEQIAEIADLPLWFVHCQADPTVDPTITSVPTYERLLAAGAENLHFSYYESIVDPEYGNAYNGHNSWVYSLLNLCSTDFDGSPVTVDGNEVTLYEWLNLQSR